ncbi:MAG: hypothetical protein IKW76_09220, partial [Clostridia bacterium]|nr:hypothetical protein [Clostridia bacterium]
MNLKRNGIVVVLGGNIIIAPLVFIQNNRSIIRIEADFNRLTRPVRICNRHNISLAVVSGESTAKRYNISVHSDREGTVREKDIRKQNISTRRMITSIPKSHIYFCQSVCSCCTNVPTGESNGPILVYGIDMNGICAERPVFTVCVKAIPADVSIRRIGVNINRFVRFGARRERNRRE